MGYFTNQIRKSYYAALLTAFYIALQAFIMLTDAGPASPNLRDVQSMYMMQTLRSVNDDLERACAELQDVIRTYETNGGPTEDVCDQA